MAAKTTKTTRPTPPPDEIITTEVEVNVTNLIHSAMASRWMARNAETRTTELVDRLIRSLRHAADDIERERNRIGTGQWPKTPDQVAENAVHTVNWMLANLDEDGLVRAAVELAGARERLAQMEKTIEMVGKKDTWDALIAAREAANA